MVEASLLEAAIKGLIAAGPVAILLGLFCYALWKQNRELLQKLERQHDKMLRLAVRVQRAVEVLAGIEHEHTEIDEVLDQDTRKKKDEKDEDD